MAKASSTHASRPIVGDIGGVYEQAPGLHTYDGMLMRGVT